MLWNNPQKNLVRSVVMDAHPLSYMSGASRQRTARVAISLPGANSLCVKEGYASGLYGACTNHVFVERDPAIVARLRRSRFIHSMASEPHVHADVIHRLPLGAVAPRGVDFAYLDFCGSLNPRVANWCHKQLFPAMNIGSSVSFTFYRSWRADLFVRHCNETFRSTRVGRDMLADTYELVNSTVNVGSCDENYVDIDDDEMRSTRRPTAIVHRCRLHNHITQQLCPVYHDISVKLLAAVRMLMPDISFTLHGLFEYTGERNPSTQRGSAMTTLCLRDLGCGNCKNTEAAGLQVGLRDFFTRRHDRVTSKV